MPADPGPRRRADKILHEPPLDAPVSSRRCWCSAATLSSPAGDIVVLRVAGEVDAESFAVLDAALDEVLDRRPGHLIIDLTGLTVCSSRGITAIARAARTAVTNGVGYSMSGASALITRIWPYYWPEEQAPRIHRTTASAVLAAVALQADRWNPAAVLDPVRERAGTDVHGPDSRPTAAGEGTDTADLLSRDPNGRPSRPDVQELDVAALQLALRRHRSNMYRTALNALGASYGAHPLATDLAAQLRAALTGFVATPPDDGTGTLGTP